MIRPVLVLASLFATLAPGGALAAASTGAQYGAAVTVAEATPISEILAEPRRFAGREVRVEGEVTGVCAMAGCWMELADAEGRRLRVKVDDGVIVFPPESVGERAVAQGTVTVRAMSREEYARWMRHLAEEQGESFDEATLGDGPFELVELAGHGATIGD